MSTALRTPGDNRQAKSACKACGRDTHGRRYLCPLCAAMIGPK